MLLQGKQGMCPHASTHIQLSGFQPTRKQTSVARHVIVQHTHPSPSHWDANNQGKARVHTPAHKPQVGSNPNGNKQAAVAKASSSDKQGTCCGNANKACVHTPAHASKSLPLGRKQPGQGMCPHAGPQTTSGIQPKRQQAGCRGKGKQQ